MVLLTIAAALITMGACSILDDIGKSLDALYESPNYEDGRNTLEGEYEKIL